MIATQVTFDFIGDVQFIMEDILNKWNILELLASILADLLLGNKTYRICFWM